jgi:hypothetical protein
MHRQSLERHHLETLPLELLLKELTTKKNIRTIMQSQKKLYGTWLVIPKCTSIGAKARVGAEIPDKLVPHKN